MNTLLTLYYSFIYIYLNHAVNLCGSAFATSTKSRIMYVLEWRTVSALARGLFWCLFPELRSNEGNTHQNNTRVSAETVRHESTYIILFLTRHNEFINDGKNVDLYTSSPCFTRSFSFCWWRHNRLAMTSQWPDNCDANTWQVISNSLHIDFIHDDIHGRSCKNISLAGKSPYYSWYEQKRPYKTTL